MPATLAALTAAALAGCGSAKVQRSSTPVNGGTTGGAGGSTTPPTTSPSGGSGGPASGAASGRFTGADVQTQFGEVQVAVVVDHGRITDVQWLKLPFDRPRSQFISQQAAPILRSEVLSAQSARIDLLSGATFTSDAWASSVQAALSQVH